MTIIDPIKLARQGRGFDGVAEWSHASSAFQGGAYGREGKAVRDCSERDCP
jgi:hypothetical protein